jgi:NDP-sugar pyrophosphorylase family protein
VDIMDARVAAGNLRDWAPRAFDDFAKVRSLYALPTRGYPWIEIDFPEDYQRAISEVLPDIDESNGETTCTNGSTAFASGPSL